MRAITILVAFLCAAPAVHAGWLDAVKSGASELKRLEKTKPSAGGKTDAGKGTKPSDIGTPDAGSGSEVAAAGSPSMAEAESVYTKYDFIPGDKVIFFDDFSDTDVGEFPRKWTLEGPKTAKNNTVDVVEYQGKRFLRSVPGAKGQSPATQYLRLDQKGDFPEKFTIEFDAVFSRIKETSVYSIGYRVLLVPEDRKQQGSLFQNAGLGNILISGKESISKNTRTDVELDDGKVHHVAISVNGTFVKAYIDNQRVINDPDAIRRPIKQVGIEMFTPNNFPSERLRFTNFRLAEGGKNIKSALDTDGRIVTHGILFDTGKDTIKPESLPTLKSILGLLNDDGALKFSIEGHTDNQGTKQINQPLSEKRSEAVKSWLVGKGIDAERLRTKGFGDTAPIDANATPEGRANNRRVEFVKF